MATTPWEITADFNKMLANRRQTEMETGARYDIANSEIVARQQAADTAFGRDLYKGDVAYGRTLDRDAAARQRMHEENFLTSVVYPGMSTKGRGRRGHLGGGGGSTDGGTTASINAGPSDGLITPQGAMQYYVSKGVPPAMAAGIVGNIDAESGWRPDVWSGRARGDSGTAAYAGQWRGERQQQLLNFARQQGHETPTAQDQLDYFLTEAQMGHDRGAQQAVSMAANAQSPEEAATVWMHHYERPADDSSLRRRQSVARAVFDQFGGGGGSAAPASTQRRYGGGRGVPTDTGGSNGIPTADELYAQYQAGSDGSGGDVVLDPTKRMTPWGPEDFAAENISNFTYSSVPSNMEVVGTDFYSGVQIQQMPPEMQERLLPVGGMLANETQQYLIMQPKQDQATNPWGQPIDPGAPGTETIAPEGAAASPAAIQPTGQPMTTAGVQAPPVQVQNYPTGNRTRRNANGELEFLIDGQWRPAGG